MFFKLAKFELNYFRKQPSFYVTMFIFFLLPFFAMISDNVQIGGSSNVNFNSPHAITQTMLIMSLIGMFLVANFVGGTAVRDFSHKMDGIMLSQPVSQSAYLWGRLVGALLFCLIVFSAVPLGTLIGSFWPTVDAERLGDTSLAPYFWSYLVFVIPNFIFCSVLFYVFAMKTRTMMGMYLGVVGFFILYQISQTILDNPQLVDIAALLDPFGFGAFAEATRYWTPFERNNQLVPLEGALLTNRLIWLSFSISVLIIANLTINIRAPKKIKAQKQKASEDSKPPATFSSTKPEVGQGIEWHRFFMRTKFEVMQIVKSAPFIILCIISLFSFSSVFFNENGAFGTSNWPLTRDMADLVIGAFGLMILIVMTYYSAEIVWRERQAGIGDIIESTATKNWSLYFPKIIALSVVIGSLTLVGIIFSVLYQASQSYGNFEWEVYLGLLSLRFIIPNIMNTVLAVFIQILSPNKYVGMLIFVVYFIGSVVAAQLGLEHNMFRFADAPGMPYSDINQFGHFIEARLWYNLYWFGLMVAFVVLGFGLWRRGTEYALRHRWSLLRANMGGFGSISLILGIATFIGAGSYIFYNTRVLNEFVTSDEQRDIQAAYERKYKQFESLEVPIITDVFAEVDFFPNERSLTAKGYYLLENQSSQPIEKFIVSWQGGKNRSMNLLIDGANEIERDSKFSTTWLKFDTPLPPGSSSKLMFEYSRENPGFVDSASDTRVVENGSFVNNSEIFPAIGYNANVQLVDRHERRKRDLPPPERLSKLEDKSKYGTNFIGKSADFINFETIVSTAAPQTAISPGYLQKQWSENGRNYFHFKMDAPIFNFVAFLSGNYEIKKEEYKGINIEVYHHPNHNMNVQRMIDAVKYSLDYFGKEFSPYQHRQVRIIEFPRYASFAQSFSNTIPYSEDIGFIADLREEDAIDYVTFVTAHEMAHQWWGHQVTPADVQGGAVLSETLSEYSAYMVLEKMLGKDQLRKFLKYEMDRYLRGRSREVIEEMPLYRAENQQYIHYAKGGVVMYALRDRIGEDRVNRALKKFLEKFQYASNPYPTTLDLLGFLRAESTAEDLEFINDLFERITVFDLKVKEAIASKLDNGKYKLDLTIEAGKFYADGQGEETEADLNYRFDIGVFTEDPDEAKGSDHVIYFEKHQLLKGENKVSIELDQRPVYTGVDPYIKMIDRNSNDNLREVSIE